MNWDRREAREDMKALAGITVWRKFDDAETCPDCNFYKLVERELGIKTGLVLYRDKLANHDRKECFANYIHRNALNDSNWKLKTEEEMDGIVETLIKSLISADRRFTDGRK